ncbi:MAG: hypothetical protein ABI718_07120 [Acidobacteriota bacterium]
MNLSRIMLASMGLLVLSVSSSNLLALKIEPAPLPLDHGAIYGSESGTETRRGDFNANLVITSSEEKFREWLSATPVQRDKHARSQKFRPGQKGYLVLVLTNYKVDPDQDVNLTADLTLVGPNGKLVYQHRDLGKSAWGHPRQGYLAIEPHVDFVFDRSDAPGTYTYRVTVSDHARGGVVTAEEKVVLIR